MRQTAKLSALLILGLGTLYSATYAEWTLRKHDTDLNIKILDRTTVEGHREFLGITYVRSRMSAIVKLFRDVERMPQWVYRTTHVRVEMEVSDTENYTYTVHHLPWPLADRDSYVHAKLTQDPESDALTIRAHATVGGPPPRDHCVRMPIINSFWRFTPLPDGIMKVHFQGSGDLGGNLSSGLVQKLLNRLVWRAPYHTLRDFRETIVEAKYQSATFPFIREPRIWSSP